MKILLISFILINCAHAIMYDTLPRGVRSTGYRYTVTDKIDTVFSDEASEKSLKQEVNLNAQLLADSSDFFSGLLSQLQANSPEVYQNFSAGSFILDPVSKVTVHSLGFGYGLSSKATIYSKMSFFNAKTSMNYKQVKDGNVKESGSLLNWSDDAQSNIAGGLVGVAPNVNATILQSFFVEGYGYKPLGTWESSGYGDLELGLMYNLINETKWGASLTGGVIAPTGQKDDPDNIQDIGFGDGQWDVFVEAAYGAYLKKSFFADGTFRYTRQLKGSKKMRVIDDPAIPLGKTNDDFNFKLGDKVDLISNLNYVQNKVTSFYVGHEFTYQFRSHYSSEHAISDAYYSENTDRVGHVLKVGSLLSSVTLFKDKKFALPGSVEFMLRHTVMGRNIPKVTRGEVELRLYF